MGHENPSFTGEEALYSLLENRLTNMGIKRRERVIEDRYVRGAIEGSGDANPELPKLSVASSCYNLCTDLCFCPPERLIPRSPT